MSETNAAGAANDAAPQQTGRAGGVEFRAEALRKLNSPEQVDRLMHVVGPAGVILLASLAFVLAVGLYWSIAGRVPTYVEAEGILDPAFGEQHNVVALSNGILRKILVRPGEKVSKGQLLARIEVLDDIEMRNNAQRTLAALQQERATQAAFWDSFITAQTQDFAAQKATLEDQVNWTGQQITARQKILANTTSLEAKGLATSDQVESARDAVISATNAQESARNQLQQLQAKALDLQNQRRTALTGLDDRILQAQEQLAGAAARLSERGQIFADMDGIVIEREGQINAAVEAGTPIVAIQREQPDLRGVFFADPRQGKHVTVGMAVNVTPSTASAARYGTIKGRVVWVSPAPLSMPAVTQQLGNPTLAQSLAGNTPPIAFGVALEKDPATPTGLAWTSGKGPPEKVTTGTLAQAKVAIREDAPIVLVIPALRRLTGIEP